MQDVVCQLVSIGIVPQCVMKANSDEEGTVQHGVQHGEVVLLYQLFQLELNSWGWLGRFITIEIIDITYIKKHNAYNIFEWG